MVHRNNISLFCVLVAVIAALLPSPALSLHSPKQPVGFYLAALPKPSTTPFGIRLAFADTAKDASSSVNGILSVTWSTTAPLSNRPCVLLFHPTNTTTATLALDSQRNKDDNKNSNRFDNPAFICGQSTPFIEPETQQAAHFIHTVLIDTLERYANGVGNRYQYKVGNDVDGWASELYSFSPPPSPLPTSGGASTNFLLLGDMGVANALTFPYLLKDATASLHDEGSDDEKSPVVYSAVVHVGDLGYDLNDYQGRKAQHFLRMIEPLSSSLPYMVAPGNHEAAFNFSHYRSLFRMPQWQTTENLYYSFDLGLVHIVVYNTEVFFWPESYASQHMEAMFEWLDADLRKATENRENVPWIVAVGHRPMYCSSLPPASSSSSSYFSSSSEKEEEEEEDFTSRRLRSCGWEAEASRRGIPSFCPHNNPKWCRTSASTTSRSNSNVTARGVNSTFSAAAPTTTPTRMTYPIEELFKKHSVDIFVAGHVHDYERYWPVYNYSYTSYPATAPPATATATRENSPSPLATMYRNPNATVHIISGAGGNSEMRIGPGLPPQGPCSQETPWCAFQSGHGPTATEGYDFSYSRVFVHNASHLQWQQYSATFDRIIDEFWVVQHAGRHQFQLES